MPRTLIFAGGGSGGHIFPGLAIAEQVRRLTSASPNPPAILFVCSNRTLDSEILSKAGERFITLSAAPLLLRSPKGMIRFAIGWRDTVGTARRIIRAERAAGREPHIVALGGFVAGPVVRAAQKERARITMVNLDAIPGKANRYIARRADRIFTAARVPDSHRLGREWTEAPPIVRDSARAQRPQPECRQALNLDPARPVLMITGGSQGLRSLNDFVAAFAGSPHGQRTLQSARWQILHQSGRNFDAALRSAYAAARIDALVLPFTDQMSLWWGAADLAICTAGAGNIAEIWMNKVPALVLPYPHHRDQHQKHNAAPLLQAGGIALATDHIDPTLNLQHNGPTLESLLADSGRRAAMRANLEKLGPADGATRIAQALLDG